MSSFLHSLESLDLHPKTVSDFAVRTKTGATVSLAGLALAALLLVSEVSFFSSSEVVEHMEVDATARGEVMRVNFDVVFPSLPCAIVSVDAVDASGRHQLEILHDVFKHRLAPDGTPLGERSRGDRGTLTAEKTKAIEAGRPPPAPPAPGDCGDCYGAGDAGECCNTCEEVRAVYKRRGWNMHVEAVEQCKREGFAGDLAAQVEAREGCNVYGHLEVPKVPGNLHFAPSHALTHPAHDGARPLEPAAFALSAFNISHRINALSFGPYYPGAHYPLDSRERSVETGTGTHQYFVKLVPTVFTPLGGAVAVKTYQFSVTEHLRIIEPASATLEAAQGVLPGVFFNYELSPLRARIEIKRRSFGHFLTRVCAVIGGVFVVMGVADALLFRVVEDMNKGRRRGGVFGGLAKD